MFSPFERLVAMRYLRARRKEGFISVIAIFSFLGIMLGVATLIIVMAVMNGFRHEMLAEILGFNGHLTIQSSKGALPDYEVLTKAVRGMPMVKSADPIIQGQVMVTSQGRSAGIAIRGVRPEDIKARAAIADHMLAGSLNSFSGQDVVIVGSYLAQDLGIGVGGEITLISPQSTTTMVGQIPRIKSYQVVGIFKTGMYIYDHEFAFMPLEAAQLYFKLPQSASQLEVTLDDSDRVAAASEAIQSRIGPGFIMTDWQAENANYFSAIVVERNVMFLILTLIIIVAAFNVISGQIMLVKDKGRDIAILRTMGATRGMIMRIFLLSGASIGIAGTAAGFGLGLAFADNIESIRQAMQYLLRTKLFPDTVYFLSKLPAIVDPREVTLVVVMSLVLSFLATLYPAYKAASTDPVQVLRYE